MFDPSRKPRVPQSVKDRLEYRQHYFDPKIGEDEDGFSLKDAESLGWKVDVFRAVKHFPGRGQIEVHAGGDADSVLKAIYEFELREHQRARGRAREVFARLVRAERLQLGALNAARAAREGAQSWELDMSNEARAYDIAYEAESQARREAIGHARQALTLSAELDAYGLLELPQEYLDELRESKPPQSAMRKGPNL